MAVLGSEKRKGASCATGLPSRLKVTLGVVMPSLSEGNLTIALYSMQNYVKLEVIILHAPSVSVIIMK